MSANVSEERQPLASARPIGHRDVVTIALPIMISNATVPLIGFVDTVVVGQLGEAYLIGGVAVGATIFSYLYWVFGFLRMGTTGLTAQALGATLGATRELPRRPRSSRPLLPPLSFPHDILPL